MKNKNYTIKKRSEGETCCAMSDCVWEMSNTDIDVGKTGLHPKKKNRRKKK